MDVRNPGLQEFTQKYPTILNGSEEQQEFKMTFNCKANNVNLGHVTEAPCLN